MHLDQLLPCLNQTSFCVFQGWKNRKILAFQDFFTGNNFPQQKMYCVFVDVSERAILLSRHKTGVKKDITL